jgi:hypothetical protein
MASVHQAIYNIENEKNRKIPSDFHNTCKLYIYISYKCILYNTISLSSYYCLIIYI